MWLSVKYYKTGENRKLSPRRRGPWTVMQKLPNVLNFKIFNNHTRETKIVHHDRLTPFKETSDADNSKCNLDNHRHRSITSDNKSAVSDLVESSEYKALDKEFFESTCSDNFQSDMDTNDDSEPEIL